MLALLRPRCKKLTEFVDQLRPFFEDPTGYDAEGVKKHLSAPGTARSSARRCAMCSQRSSGTKPHSSRRCASWPTTREREGRGMLIHGTRLALTGRMVSPGLFEMLVLIGRETRLEASGAAGRHAMKRRDFIETVGMTAAGPSCKPSALTPLLTERNRADRIRLHHRRRRLGRLRAGESAERRSRRLRVLLLEAGGPTNDDPAITTPGKWVSLIGSKYDWGYSTEPEAGPAESPHRVSARQGASAARARSTRWRSSAATSSASIAGSAPAIRAGATTRCCRYFKKSERNETGRDAVSRRRRPARRVAAAPIRTRATRRFSPRSRSSSSRSTRATTSISRRRSTSPATTRRTSSTESATASPTRS